MRKLEVPLASPCRRPCLGSSRLFIHSVHVHLLVEDHCYFILISFSLVRLMEIFGKRLSL